VAVDYTEQRKYHKSPRRKEADSTEKFMYATPNSDDEEDVIDNILENLNMHP